MSNTTTLDEMCAGAATGAMPIIVAVAASPADAQEVVEWLESGVPALAPAEVVRVTAGLLLGALDEPAQQRVIVVPDATAGDPTTVAERWSLWDLHRERLLSNRHASTTLAVVLMATEAPFQEVAQRSRNLLSATTVFSVSRSEAADAAATRDCELVLRELETRYGIATAEIQARMLTQGEIPVPEHDLARWLAAARVALPRAS